MSREIKITVFVFAIALCMVALAAFYNMKQRQDKPARILETFGMVEADSISADGDTLQTRKVHTVGQFAFTDQRGNTVTRNTLKGRIYVADFFFTTCQSICPVMSTHISRLAKKLAEEPRVAFLSHTVDPETDSVPVLKAYADLHNARYGQWYLVTGDKKELYDVARYDYFVTAMEGDGGQEDFIHTQNFALIDTHGRIRGYYDGTSSEEMTKLERDLDLLLQEEFGQGLQLAQQ